MKRFLEKLNEAIIQSPEAPCLRLTHASLKEETLTYGELKEHVEGLTADLENQSEKGDLIFILSPNPKTQILRWIASVLHQRVPAILTPPTPKIDPLRYRAQLEKFSKEYSHAALWHTEEIEAELGLSTSSFKTIQTQHNRKLDWNELYASERTQNTPFLFQQSSGTTGFRKGVLFTEPQVIRQLDHYGRAIEISAQDRIISWLPLYHDMGLVACFLQALYQGLPLITCSPFTWLNHPEWWIQKTAEHKATLCWMPNFAFSFLAKKVDLSHFRSDSLSSLRLLISCAETVLPQSFDEFVSHFSSIGFREDALGSSYAMAENVFAVTQSPMGQAPNRLRLQTQAFGEGRIEKDPEGREYVSSGLPLDLVDIQVRNSKGDLRNDQIGEILIKSDCLFDSYFGVGSEQVAIDSSGYFATGDLGFFHKGELYVIGRKKDLIIRAGVNIHPHEIEEIVSRVKFVKEGRVACFGLLEDSQATESLVIVAEIDPIRADNMDRIKREISQRLAEELDLSPDRIEIVRSPWLVKSSSGKISRAGSRDKYREMLEKRKQSEISVFDYAQNLPEETLDSFQAFGAHSKIRTPVEITNPGHIQIGNFVSLGRNGKILILNDFSVHEKYARQHYPHSKEDFDPAVYGKRNPQIKFGDGTSIGDQFLIAATRYVEFGKHVLASGRLFVSDSNHRVDVPDLPISLQSNTLGTPLIVGEHSWLGINVSLLEGAKIGRHCVISTSTVVNFEVPDYAVVAGNPARIVRFLNQGESSPSSAKRQDVHSSQKKQVEEFRHFFRSELGLDVEPHESLIQSGLVNSLRFLRVLEFIERQSARPLNEVEFLRKRPDTIHEIIEVLTEMNSRPL